MKGQVSGQGKVIQFAQKPGGQPRSVVIPSPEEVREAARDAARQDVSEVAKVLGEKIAMLYTEEVKTAVLLNALIELLVEKGVFTRDEYKARVSKREAETRDRYVKATEAIKKGQNPESIILGEKNGG